MTRRYFLRLTASLLALLSFLVTAPGRAETNFLFYSARPSVVNFGGAARIFALAETLVASFEYFFLAWKTPTGDWHPVAQPSFPTSGTVQSFYPVTGTAAVVPPTSWGSGDVRVYAISNADGTHAAALWEYTYHALSSTETWRFLGDPSSVYAGANLANSPAIAALYTPSTFSWGSGIRLGIRLGYTGSAYDGHYFSCHIATPTAGCAWEDEAGRGGTGVPAETQGPIAVNYNPASSGEFEIYTVTPAGDLQQYGYSRDSTISLGRPSTTVTVDFMGIQPWTVGSRTNVLVAGWNHTSGLDSLYLVENGTGGAWAFHDLGSGGPSMGIDYSSTNIAVEATSGTAWVTDYAGRNLWRCLVLGNTCSWTGSIGHPSDILASRDYLGGGVTALGTSAYVTGSMGSIVEYLYEYSTSDSGWRNHLAPRNVGTALPEYPRAPDQNYSSEYSAAEYFGTILMTGYNIPSPESLSTTRSVVWRSDDDGSTWTGPTEPISVFLNDTEMVADAAGNFYMLGFDAYSNLHVARNVAGTWSADAVVATDLADRPYVVADPVVPNTLYMVYSAYTGGATPEPRFRYCNGGASGDCLSSSRWCSPIVLPSGANCSSGCGLTRTTDGTLWLAIRNDTGCTIPSGYTSVDPAWGIRRITNLVGAGSSCVVPALTPPASSPPEACIFYKNIPNYTINPGGGAMSGLGPAHFRNAVLPSFSAGTAGRVALSAVVFRNTVDGSVCQNVTSPVSHCRGEVAVAVRNPANGTWCGGTAGISHCAATLTQSDLFIVNTDPLNDAGGEYWVDHLLPTISAFVGPGDQYAITWLDFSSSTRGTSNYDLRYGFRNALLGFNHTSLLLSATPSNWWDVGYGFYRSNNPGQEEGDVNLPANAGLHTHFFNELTVDLGHQTPITLLSSPWSILGH